MFHGAENTFFLKIKLYTIRSRSLLRRLKIRTFLFSFLYLWGDLEGGKKEKQKTFQLIKISRNIFHASAQKKRRAKRKKIYKDIKYDSCFITKQTEKISEKFPSENFKNEAQNGNKKATCHPL